MPVTYRSKLTSKRTIYVNTRWFGGFLVGSLVVVVVDAQPPPLPQHQQRPRHRQDRADVAVGRLREHGIKWRRSRDGIGRPFIPRVRAGRGRQCHRSARQCFYHDQQRFVPRLDRWSPYRLVIFVFLLRPIIAGSSRFRRSTVRQWLRTVGCLRRLLNRKFTSTSLLFLGHFSFVSSWRRE